MFDAPRELVWQAFTESERMKEWWGPKGFTVIHSKMDLRPGGTYHYGMKAPDGTPIWGKLVFREIVRRSAWCSSTRSRTRPAAPRATAAPVLAAGDALDLHVRGAAGRQDQAHDPLVAPQRTEEERKTFDTNHDSMRMGWSGSLEQLEAYLAKARQG